MPTSTIPQYIVSARGTVLLISDDERRILHKCGLLHNMAVDGRWHTDAPLIQLHEVLEVAMERRELPRRELWPESFA